eukprot:7495165-Pyramimonas_sp.AAC.1
MWEAQGQGALLPAVAACEVALHRQDAIRKSAGASLPARHCSSSCAGPRERQEDGGRISGGSAT